jgi:hypothetical protein
LSHPAGVTARQFVGVGCTRQVDILSRIERQILASLQLAARHGNITAVGSVVFDLSP